MAAALIEIRLPHPVANRLRGRLELLRQLLRTASRLYQLNHSPPLLRCILCMALGHRGSPSLSPLRHCPPNRVNSNEQKLPENSRPYDWLRAAKRAMCVSLEQQARACRWLFITPLSDVLTANRGGRISGRPANAARPLWPLA